MKLMVCSIMDSSVGVYSPPMVFRTKGEAIRSFTDAVKDNNLPFNKHPEDYRLWFLGEWDDNSGLLTPMKPEPILGAAEVG